MQLKNIKVTKEGKMIIHQKYTFFGFDLFPNFFDMCPEIILTKKEAKERKLNHLITGRVGVLDKVFGNGKESVAYVMIDGMRVPITIENATKKTRNS